MKEPHEHLTTPLLRLYRLVRYGDPWVPLSVSIEISTTCNRSCYYCANSAWPRRAQQYMPAKDFESILERLVEAHWLGSISYHWLNEPLLDPRLALFVRMTRDALPLCPPLVFTNGDSLNADWMHQLIDAGVSRIIITQHPPSSDVWRANIRSLRRTFPGFITLRGQDGVIEDEDWLENFSGQSKPKHYTPMTKCRVPSRNFQILHDGTVNLCCICFPVMKMGNILHEPLLQIWRKYFFVSIRKNVAKGNPTLRQCKGCFGL